MNAKQHEQIKALVDAGGWDAVHANRELNEVWQAERKAAREYVDKVVDVEWNATR